MFETAVRPIDVVSRVADFWQGYAVIVAELSSVGVATVSELTNCHWLAGG